jgi:hypothetical protein
MLEMMHVPITLPAHYTFCICIVMSPCSQKTCLGTTCHLKINTWGLVWWVMSNPNTEAGLRFGGQAGLQPIDTPSLKINK